MADEQDANGARLPLVLGHEVTRALRGIGERDPFRREAERVERRTERGADLAHAREVERAARDVHDALEVRDLVVVRALDGFADLLFGGRERRLSIGEERRRDAERGEKAGGADHFVSAIGGMGMAPTETEFPVTTRR